MGILDTPAEEGLDRIVEMAMAVFQAPIGAIGFVDGTRVWFKASRGAQRGEVDRDIAFCSHAILGDEPLCIPDASVDERFRDSPLVCGRKGLRFYAGVPLRFDGFNVGTLCVLDHRSGVADPEKLHQLKLLGQIAMSELEHRRLAVKADAASREKSLFLANVSHEIRTPMNAIIGFATLLGDAEQPEEKRAEWVDAIQRNGRNLLGVLNDILDFSKIETGLMSVDSVTTDAGALVEEAVTALRPAAGAHGVKLEWSWEGAAAPKILSDPVRVRQILVNLIGNAIKFSDQGGRVTVLVRSKFQGSLGEVEFCVADHGIGMTPQQISRLFSPFCQGDETSTRQFGGAGLGLAISKRLADLLGGEISVVSEFGMGSTFSFRLPAQAAPGCGESKPALNLPRIDGRQILVVEDGPDNQALVRAFLQRAGAQVTVTENGQDAIEAVEKRGGPFDCILMDIQMPVMDGITATKLLRERGYAGEIVALTANATALDRERCLLAGCDDFMAKPVDRSILIRRMASCPSLARAAA